MPPNAASDYRKHCAALIAQAVERPRMFYRELRELELILDGHWMAFQQIAGLERAESFTLSFCDWLYATRKVSGAAGWARAVAELADAADRQQGALFAELVAEFLPQWIDAQATPQE